MSDTRKQVTWTSPDDAIARGMSLWLTLLIALFMFLGGHTPPHTSASLTVLPESHSIQWTLSGDSPALARETRALALVKAPLGSGQPCVPPATYAVDELAGTWVSYTTATNSLLFEPWPSKPYAIGPPSA